jgi:lipoprotein signal peptidase
LPRASWRWFALAALVVLADQATKALVMSRFALGERLVLAPFFNLVFVYNPGAAFSFLSEAGGWQKPLLVAFAIAAAAIVSTLILRRPRERLLCTGLALILGGAIGNVIDRLRFGAVVDFIHAHIETRWGDLSWYVFNVADAAIVCGVIALIVESQWPRRRRAGPDSSSG